MIDIKSLPEEFLPGPEIEDRCLSSKLSLQECLRSFEKKLIIITLKETGGRKIETAKRLGISRKVLWKKIKEYGIDL